jgi:uracil-DNA glycosylase
MNLDFDTSWKKRLKSEIESDYFRELMVFVDDECAKNTIFPPSDKIFNAFNLCPFDSVKVVILGQDPYHGEGQAHGLCFSVNDSVPHPPSLVNIFKEIKRDLNIPVPSSGNLERWARQGVLMLNATLTVRAQQAGSHQKRGWEKFTDAAIGLLAQEKKHCVFMLWGSYAHKKGEVIPNEHHLVLKSPHPSPLSAHRGFFGNNHFSQANSYLVNHGKSAIVW